MSGAETDISDPHAALQRARMALATFSAHSSSDCSHKVASQLVVSLNELIQLTDQLLAEKEQFRSRLHRSTTISIPENSGQTAAL